MTEPFLGEIRICSFNFPPRGWAACNGQLLAISQNQALFSILGTTYGGDGRTNFALPDLRGRVPLHVGANAGMTYTLGQRAGEVNHTLSQGEMPRHSHVAVGSAGPADSGTPVGSLWAGGSGHTPFSNSFDVSMASAAVSFSGGGAPHSNMGPITVLNFVIATVGIFPSRN